MLNVQEIQEIIKLIDQSSIEEFTYETNGTTVSLKKSSQKNPVSVQDNQIHPTTKVENVQQSDVKANIKNEPVENEVTSEQSQAVAYDHEIVSPMVGTFYTAPSPEKDAFVSKGSKVDESTVVCIVEAMKLFNEIEAEVSGEIVEILVENGELVEYGQPLFRVNTK